LYSCIFQRHFNPIITDVNKSARCPNLNICLRHQLSVYQAPPVPPLGGLGGREGLWIPKLIAHEKAALRYTYSYKIELETLTSTAHKAWPNTDCNLNTHTKQKMHIPNRKYYHFTLVLGLTSNKLTLSQVEYSFTPSS
jgi:hypothetical protein